MHCVRERTRTCACVYLRILNVGDSRTRIHTVYLRVNININIYVERLVVKTKILKKTTGEMSS